MDGIKKIIDEVANSGDSALIKWTLKFDKIQLDHIEVPKNEWDVRSGDFKEIEHAADNIKKYCQHDCQQDFKTSEYEKDGIKITDKYIPLESVGIYVPGGKFPYPSTVLMCAIAARVAGVKKIYIATPPANLTPSVFAAARISGVDRIFKVGGPQAIAAFAFGTETVPKVDKIVGPGNSYVQQAKFLLSDKVGIDMIAGPSEVVIIADNSANPDWLAADLMSQLEHSDDAKATLITDSQELIDKVNKSMNGTFIKVKDMEEAVKRSNEIAPEHLQIMSDNVPINKIRNAGAVFIGKWTPVAVGDYWAGPSHVLPTGGNAKFQEGLSVRSFLKKVSFIECSADGIKKAAAGISKFAETEGMNEHSKSVLKRIEK